MPVESFKAKLKLGVSRPRVRCVVGGQEVSQLTEQSRRALAFGHIDIDERTDLIGQTHISREQKNGYVRFCIAHLFGDFAAMHPRHCVVEYDGCHWLRREQLQSGLAVRRGEDVITGAFEQYLPNAQSDDLIVYAKYQVAPTFHLWLRKSPGRHARSGQYTRRIADPKLDLLNTIHRMFAKGNTLVI